jgi:hypothetical protein
MNLEKEFLLGITKVRAAHSRKLPRKGTGAFLNEQQYCYDLGYREGIAALRKAQREHIEELFKI